MDAKLRIIAGPLSGQLIQVPRGKLLIGRAADCDLRPSSPFVSAHHCVFLLDEFTLRIRDLGSKNGTTVNGRRMGTSPIIVFHDDLVAIGDLCFLIDLSESYSQTSLPVLPSALRGTDVFEGDTVQAEIAGASPPASSASAPVPLDSVPLGSASSAASPPVPPPTGSASTDSHALSASPAQNPTE
jgi:predicted component of type VI protein secretion system